MLRRRTPSSSWPGLTRPSTSRLQHVLEDVDARDKRGHHASCVAMLHRYSIADRTLRIEPNRPADRHAPPPGLAFGEPDDRLQRGIQHAKVLRFIADVSEYSIIRFRGR